MIQSVPPEALKDAYPELQRFFASFVERSKGDIRPGTLEAEVLTGQRQCYVALVDGEIRACALSTVGPGGGITLDFCAGEGRGDWGEDMLGMFMEWAKASGALLRVNCRSGWVRALDMRGKGFRETHRIMEVDYGR